MAHTVCDLSRRIANVEVGVLVIDDATMAYLNAFALVDSAGNLDPANVAACAGVIIEPSSSMTYDNLDSAALDPRCCVQRKGQAFGPYTAEEGAAPTANDVGRPVFAVDDQTPSLQPFDADGDVRAFIGYVDKVIDAGVYIEPHPAIAPPVGVLGAYATAPTQTLLAGGNVRLNRFQVEYPVVGDGGAVELTEDLPVGFYDGQRAVFRGTDDTNTVKISDGNGIQLQDGQAITLGKYDELLASYDDGNDVWIEISRSTN